MQSPRSPAFTLDLRRWQSPAPWRELVHAIAYGYGITGAWFVGGYLLGYAFQRTRSLAVPTLLHAGHNFLLYVLVWYLNR